MWKNWLLIWIFGADSALFDASQYAFFGRDISEEVELGGLEDEQENNDLAVGGGLGDDEIHEYHLFEKDEVQSICTFRWILHNFFAAEAWISIKGVNDMFVHCDWKYEDLFN